MSVYAAWPKNVAAQLLFGSYWQKAALSPSPYLELLPHALAHPVATTIAVLAMATFLVLGSVVFWRAPPHGRRLRAMFGLPGVFPLATAVIKEQYLFEWYFSYLLPGLAAVLPAGAWRAVAGSLRDGIPCGRAGNLARRIRVGDYSGANLSPPGIVPERCPSSSRTAGWKIRVESGVRLGETPARCPV